MRVVVLASILIIATTINAIADDDTYVKIQEMMNDLGGPQMQKKNNGRSLKCASKGTKKITVTSGGDSTTYEGVYNNCSEYGRQRDGNVSITIGGGGSGETKATQLDRLFDAIYDDDLALVKKLANKKLVNQSKTVGNGDGGTTSKWTPLMFASQNNKIEVVKILVQAGANINSVNSDGTNSFWLAADKSNNDIAIYLANKGSNINTTLNTNGYTALHIVAEEGNDQLLDFLLKHKNINLNQLTGQDGDEVNALFIAINKRHYIIAHKLLNAGIDVDCANDEGYTPLMVAALRQQPDLVSAILTKTPDLSATNDDDETYKDIVRRVSITNSGD
jgi:hypothetical protein